MRAGCAHGPTKSRQWSGDMFNATTEMRENNLLFYWGVRNEPIIFNLISVVLSGKRKRKNGKRVFRCAVRLTSLALVSVAATHGERFKCLQNARRNCDLSIYLSIARMSGVELALNSNWTKLNEWPVGSLSNYGEIKNYFQLLYDCYLHRILCFWINIEYRVSQLVSSHFQMCSDAAHLNAFLLSQFPIQLNSISFGFHSPRNEDHPIVRQWVNSIFAMNVLFNNLHTESTCTNQIH